MQTAHKFPANRLIEASSTYLLQHAHNPVEWYPWSQEALEKAVALDKPIMLSIGYSACHWCHVMEEESFEDEDTAKMINQNFVAIKVDREERPDIDDIYMTAVQLMTGHGGWPLTVFLTPKLKPFFGGTYFPKEDKQYGNQIMPGFKTILKAVSQSWLHKRKEIESSAENITTTISALSLQMQQQERPASIEHSQELLVDLELALLSRLDKKWGGFGRAPKFPQVLCLLLCLRAAFKLKQIDDQRYKLFVEAVTVSLNRMASGGIYDHLGGGFARYSTDEKWCIPHFEKMLYDNALLAQIYFEAFTFSSNKLCLQVGCETLDFLMRDLSSPEGAFYSSLDADSEGSEGKFYIWEKKEIDNILSKDAELFCLMFSVVSEGNFEKGQNIQYLPENYRLADKSICDEHDFARIEEMKKKLLQYRKSRISPSRDEKILTSWNALCVSSFVHGYKVTGESKYLDQAKKTGQFILSILFTNGRLKHSYANGNAKGSAFLDDYAFFVRALIDLASVDGDSIWLAKAIEIINTMLLHFYDEQLDDFFYTADDDEKLISRPRNYSDGPTPSATSVSLFNLIILSLITGKAEYRLRAEKILCTHIGSFPCAPIPYANMISAWDLYMSSANTFVFVASGNKALDEELLLSLYSYYLPDKVVIIKDASQGDKADYNLPIFEKKDLVDNKPTIYICNLQGCLPAINNPAALKKTMEQLLKGKHLLFSSI